MNRATLCKIFRGLSRFIPPRKSTGLAGRVGGVRTGRGSGQKRIRAARRQLRRGREVADGGGARGGGRAPAGPDSAEGGGRQALAAPARGVAGRVAGGEVAGR